MCKREICPILRYPHVLWIGSSKENQGCQKTPQSALDEKWSKKSEYTLNLIFHPKIKLCKEKLNKCAKTFQQEKKFYSKICIYKTPMIEKNRNQTKASMHFAAALRTFQLMSSSSEYSSMSSSWSDSASMQKQSLMIKPTYDNKKELPSVSIFLWSSRFSSSSSSS